MNATQLRATYREQYPRCQYTQAVGRFVRFPQHIHWQTATEHIWNRKGPHSEHWSNYATTLPGPHDWKHANSVTARVAMMWFKWRLAITVCDSRHFDVEALRLAAGFNVVAWVERKLDTVPWWCRRMGEELVRGCE